jgi:hypothetical protein
MFIGYKEIVMMDALGNTKREKTMKRGNIGRVSTKKNKKKT